MKGHQLNREESFKYLGTDGLYAKIHGVSKQRAVIEVAKLMSIINDFDYSQHLKFIQEPEDGMDSYLAAIELGQLVFVEDRRELYWKEKKIGGVLAKTNRLWYYFLALAESRKKGRSLSYDYFQSNAPQSLSKLKYRLKKLDGFPVDLFQRIQSAESFQQELDLERDQIRFFKCYGDDHYEEYTP
ncbi:MAG: hypothetical protein COA78_30605 [Blastopirellula sp.]|nr:MAG: hypothetical protein COA78_30605 [Blastopirellula sp.]